MIPSILCYRNVPPLVELLGLTAPVFKPGPTTPPPFSKRLTPLLDHNCLILHLTQT